MTTQSYSFLILRSWPHPKSLDAVLLCVPFLNFYISILQALPDVPPAMADAVNRGSELLANLTVGTPWETVAKEVGNSFGADSPMLRAEVSKDVDLLVDVISSWMASNTGPKLLRR